MKHINLIVALGYVVIIGLVPAEPILSKVLIALLGIATGIQLSRWVIIQLKNK